jgi:hypothetical protein
MGAQGTATVDFGAFPGASDASVVVTGQAGIVSGSLVEAWLRPVATADHTADEHMVETLKVFAHSIVAATGFTITVFNTSQLNEPLEFSGVAGGTVRGGATGATAGPLKGTGGVQSEGGIGTRIWGQWTVAWVWN